MGAGLFKKEYWFEPVLAGFSGVDVDQTPVVRSLYRYRSVGSAGIEEDTMKRLIRACLISALMSLPVAAAAQNAPVPKADEPKSAPGMMMACPMMGEMAAMQKDMGAMMSEVEDMMKDAKEPAQNEHLRKMHDRMAVMMVSMQKMSAMHGMANMMGRSGMPGAPATNNIAPAAPAPSNAAPISPDDHQAHHPAP